MLILFHYLMVIIMRINFNLLSISKSKRTTQAVMPLSICPSPYRGNVRRLQPDGIVKLSDEIGVWIKLGHCIRWPEIGWEWMPCKKYLYLFEQRQRTLKSWQLKGWSVCPFRNYVNLQWPIRWESLYLGCYHPILFHSCCLPGFGGLSLSSLYNLAMLW